jgi:hypothetical protein
MEGAVEFLELVSADLDTGTDKAISEAKRRVVCERIAGLNNLLAPMLRLPAHLQERVASSQVMIGVLDEMFIERPVALFVVTMDFFCVVAMLTLVLKIGWHVQHPGALRYGEWGQILVVLALNSYYLAREANNAIAMHRLGLQIDSQDVVDFTTIGFVTLTMILCLSEDTRMNDLFQMVAAVASGLCWFKLLGFLAGFNLKFALYYKSLIHITLALRSFVTILFLVMGMFASMFYLVINKRQWDRTEPREFDDGEIDDAFRTVGESFITLFRMMLGDFDREWFIQRTYSVNFFSTCLFIGYMIIVFIVMLNVLIAVVCDNYDYAMSKSRELFLRTRLALVAGLELQGYTTKRPKARDQVIESSDIGTRQSIFQRGRAATMRQSLVNGPATPAVIPLSVRLTGLSFLDRIDKYLKLTLWHRAMRKLVQLRYMFDDSGGDEDWNGRVKHLEREVTNIVNRRVTAAEERMIRAFEQHLERREAMYAAENHAKQAAAPGPPQQPAAPSDHAPPPGQSQSSSRSVQLAPTATPNSERTRPLSVQTSTPKKGVQMAQEPSSAKKGVQMAQEPSRSPKKKGVQMVPES